MAIPNLHLRAVGLDMIDSVCVSSDFRKSVWSLCFPRGGNQVDDPACSHLQMRSWDAKKLTEAIASNGSTTAKLSAATEVQRASPYGPTVLLNPKPLCSYEAG